MPKKIKLYKMILALFSFNKKQNKQTNPLQTDVLKHFLITQKIL